MYYDNGDDWYEQQFDNVEDCITGEATPRYFWNPAAAQRIYKYNPAMKIIILLRERQSAIRSKYNQQVSKGVETLPFDQAMELESVRIKGDIERATSLPYNYYPALYSEFAYQDRYDYDKHLEYWQEFDRLIITDFFTNSAKRYKQCFEFLGLEPETYEWEILNKGI
jgi:hypothetical protein